MVGGAGIDGWPNRLTAGAATFPSQRRKAGVHVDIEEAAYP